MNARNLELELTRSSSVLSFSSLFTSTDSSSSFSSQSTKTPYFYERRRRGVTLQSLLNTTPSTLHISMATSTTPSPPPPRRLEIGGLRKSHVTHNKPKSWLHSLCSKPASHDTDDATSTTRKSQLSLSYLLQQERVMSIRRGLRAN
ncbi:hypothetical protein V2J09_012044 [Rumex salicifolius]